MTIDVEATTKRDLMTKAGRRSFLKGLGYGAAGAAAGGLAISAASPAFATASTDVQILTFALNLEYLEAEYYLLAATGMGLNGADKGGNPGQTIKPTTTKVPFTSPINAAYAAELATEEQTHVRFLRSAIAATGAVPISFPTIDLLNSFKALGNMIGVANFNPFTNDLNFLLGSYIFEDVGVTAYHGALTSIVNKAYLDAASGIMATEAYHAGIVRTALFVAGASNATNAISYVRQQATGVAGTPAQGNDHGVGTTSSPSILDADGNAIAWDRSVRQVLNVVYGTQNASSGGFFPNGVNSAF